MTPRLVRSQYIAAALATLAAHSASVAQDIPSQTDLSVAARAAEAQLRQSFANLRFEEFGPAPVTGPLFQASAAMMVLVAVGGVLYTLGAVVYALKRPNPWPNHFGFHEIFHVCTVLAFLCHWTACLLIGLSPAYHG